MERLGGATRLRERYGAAGIEGKGARVAMSDSGSRASFKSVAQPVGVSQKARSGAREIRREARRVSSLVRANQTPYNIRVYSCLFVVSSESGSESPHSKALRAKSVKSA